MYSHDSATYRQSGQDCNDASTSATIFSPSQIGVEISHTVLSAIARWGALKNPDLATCRVVNAIARAHAWQWRCTVTGIARELDLPISKVSRIVSLVESIGGIVNTPDRHDHRVRNITFIADPAHPRHNFHEEIISGARLALEAPNLLAIQREEHTA